MREQELDHKVVGSSNPMDDMAKRVRARKEEAEEL
jgi:hypothetical protein